jgi:ribosomal protein L29
MKRKQELSELREMTVERLQEELKAARMELFQNRMRYATRNLDHPEPLRRGKKKIARLMTILQAKTEQRG